MPVNATIPLTQDFLQTTGTYPLLTELIQHPTNGYLYGCYTEAGVGKILKLKNDDYADVTVASLPVTAPIDMHYSVTNDRFYVVYRTTNSPVTEVHPTTLAMAAFFSITSVGGQGAIAGDTSNLYVATFSTQKLYSISLATGLQVGLRTMPATGYAKINCLRYFSPKLYALSMDVDYVQLSRIVPATLGTEEVSTPIGIDAGEVPVDDMGESSGHIYVGNRDLLGIIRKFSKTDFLNPELIETAQLSKCTCAKTVGPYVWAAFENGRGVRINPANIPDRRIYTLNDGQGYHSEFTGLGNEFVHTYNLSTSKIQRYRIPPDVASSSIAWLKTTAHDTQAIANGVAIDSSGNIIIVGKFNGSCDFGDGNPISSGGVTANAFIAKYDPDKTLIWVKGIGSTGEDIGKAVAADSDGNIFVLGTFNGTVNFGDGHSETSSGGSDIFIAKYSPGSTGVPGTCQWSNRYGNVSADFGTCIAVNSSGDVIIGVNFIFDIDFGGATSPITNSGNYDFAIAKLNGGTGIADWARAWGGTGQLDGIGALALDASGDIYATGRYTGGVGGTLGGTLLPGSDSSGIYVAKYLGSNGNFVWATVHNSSSGTAGANGIAVHPVSGNIVVTGTSTGSLTFGTGSIAGGIWIAGFSSSGSSLWMLGSGTNGNSDTGIAIAINPNGVIAVVGGCQSFLNWGGGNLFGTGYWIATFQMTGNSTPTFRWGKFTSASALGGLGNAVKADGSVSFVSAGTFAGTTDFNSPATPPNSAIADPGTTAMFAVKYAT